MITQQDMQLFNQEYQQKYIKIQILNWDENVIDEIQGKCLGGNINIDATQIVRRTSDITMVLDNNKYIPSPSSPIWINKKIKIFIGIKDNISNDIKWFNKGIYILFKPSLKYNDKDKTLSLQALDKMCWHNGQLSGKLQYVTTINGELPKIKEYTPVFDAVKTTIQQLGGETKIIIDDVKDDNGNDLLVPYTIKKSEDNTITDLLTEIRDLYMFYEYYYDEDGRFHFEKIKNRSTDMIHWDFTNTKLILSYENTPNWENVKNNIIIWGAMLKDGRQIKCQIKNNDINSLFSISKIGERKETYKNDKIIVLSQAKIRAEYEMWRHSNLNEVISFDSLPVYSLDVNKKIYIQNNETNIEGEYLIDKISFDLNNDNMNITASKIYDESKNIINYSISIDDDIKDTDSPKNNTSSNINVSETKDKTDTGATQSGGYTPSVYYLFSPDDKIAKVKSVQYDEYIEQGFSETPHHYITISSLSDVPQSAICCGGNSILMYSPQNRYEGQTNGGMYFTNQAMVVPYINKYLAQGYIFGNDNGTINKEDRIPEKPPNWMLDKGRVYEIQDDNDVFNPKGTWIFEHGGLKTASSSKEGAEQYQNGWIKYINEEFKKWCIKHPDYKQ